MFRVGDTVIHPSHGAGTVIDIEKLQSLGSDKMYYSIELLDGSKTRVWVPVKDAGTKGGAASHSQVSIGPDMARLAVRAGDAVPRSQRTV
jgi:RNA polymerase-interacting CarD/CdnL/TRCF family regulator